MKFSAIFLTTLLSTASAFSPSVAFNGRAATARYVATDPETSTGPSTDPVDKTLAGIDDAAEHDVFDPHAGSEPALTRNNNDEVWVSQVRISFRYAVLLFCFTLEEKGKDGNYLFLHLYICTWTL